jgi:DNA transformation protein
MPFPPFVEHCVELLAPQGEVRVRRMFGGFGLYVQGLFMAIITSDRLYLKTTPADRDAFAAAGCEPFVYSTRTGAVALGYWSAPAEALDSPALMQPWARRAVQAALTARAAKPPAPALSKPLAGSGGRAGPAKATRGAKPPQPSRPSAPKKRAPRD